MDGPSVSIPGLPVSPRPNSRSSSSSGRQEPAPLTLPQQTPPTLRPQAEDAATGDGRPKTQQRLRASASELTKKRAPLRPSIIIIIIIIIITIIIITSSLITHPHQHPSKSTSSH
jgi:hypothetical protein